MSKEGRTYITTTRKNTVLYTGVTSELRNRIYKNKKNYTQAALTGRRLSEPVLRPNHELSRVVADAMTRLSL